MTTLMLLAYGHDIEFTRSTTRRVAAAQSACRTTEGGVARGDSERTLEGPSSFGTPLEPGISGRPSHVAPGALLAVTGGDCQRETGQSLDCGKTTRFFAHRSRTPRQRRVSSQREGQTGCYVTAAVD